MKNLGIRDIKFDEKMKAPGEIVGLDPKFIDPFKALESIIKDLADELAKAKTDLWLLKQK